MIVFISIRILLVTEITILKMIDTYDNCEDFIGDDKNECIGVGEYDDEDEHFQKGKLFIGS